MAHRAALGHIVKCLHNSHDEPQTLILPDIPPGGFEKKQYSMYLNYLSKEKLLLIWKWIVIRWKVLRNFWKPPITVSFPLISQNPALQRDSTGIIANGGFFVVYGHGLIQERKIGTDEALEFEVSGDKIRAVHMLPGYTHNIINLSQTENLVTLMWANEIFDSAHPDTFGEAVKKWHGSWRTTLWKKLYKEESTLDIYKGKGGCTVKKPDGKQK